MARKSYPKCVKCRKWTVGGANYCHHCGHYLKGNPNEFNSTVPIAPGPTKPRQPGSNNHKVVLAEGGLITVLAVTDMVALGQEAYTVALGLSIPLMAYTIPKLAPAVSGFIVDVKTVWVKPPGTAGNQANPKPSILQVEFIDEHGRPRVLQDFPQEIELIHLWHIGQRLDNGKSFARRQMLKSGVLTQPQFESIADTMLQKRWAYKKYPDADNSPVILRQSGLAVIHAAKNQYNAVVVGGGWGAGSKKSVLFSPGRAGEGA